jgi:hypothetical protein
LAAFVGRALGSELRLFVQPAEQDDAAHASAAPDGAAAAAWRAVLAEFDAVDRALSRFRDDSELTALNGRAGSGGVVTVSWRLREAVAAMHRAGRLTGGRFDPTVVEVLESIGEHGATAADVYAAPGPSAPDGLERARPIRVPDRAIDTGGGRSRCCRPPPRSCSMRAAT